MDRVLFREHASECYLMSTPGEVRRYNGSPLPQFLRWPRQRFSFYEKGFSKATKIGDRSCVLPLDGSWYKLKGCTPDIYAFDKWQPYGAMSWETATNELRVNRIIAEALKEYGYSPPHEPVGLVRYDVKWSLRGADRKRRNTYAAILRTRGEERVSGLKYPVSKNFSRLLGEWIGFSLRVLKEAKINPDVESISDDNVACFDVGKGYGFFLVDHEFSEVDEPFNLGITIDTRDMLMDRLFGMNTTDPLMKTFNNGRVPEPIPEEMVERAYGVS